MTAAGTKIRSQSRMGNLPKGTALYYYYTPDSAMLPLGSIAALFKGTHYPKFGKRRQSLILCNGSRTNTTPPLNQAPATPFPLQNP
jgi:hypothetical protein